MSNCPDATEIPANEKFSLIVKGCSEEDVNSKLESKLLDLAEKIRIAKNSPCVGDCSNTGGETETQNCTLWVDYTLTMNITRAARVAGCPNNVGRIGFFMGTITNAGCNCV